MGSCNQSGDNERHAAGAAEQQTLTVSHGSYIRKRPIFYYVGGISGKKQKGDLLADTKLDIFPRALKLLLLLNLQMIFVTCKRLPEEKIPEMCSTWIKYLFTQTYFAEHTIVSPRKDPVHRNWCALPPQY